MKVIKLAALSFAVFFIYGCGAKINTYQADKTQINHVSEKNYVIGELKRVRVGEEAINVRDYNQSIIDLGEMETLTSFTIDGDYYFPLGETFGIVGTTDVDGQTYSVLSARGLHGYRGLVGDNNRLFNKVLYWDAAWTASWQMASVELSPAVVEFKKVQRVINSSSVPNPRYLLIYNGANDSNFFLSYREFTIDDLARPAFTQEVVYQKKDKIIRFKNLTIEVERADNEVLVYKVIEDDKSINQKQLK